MVWPRKRWKIQWRIRFTKSAENTAEIIESGVDGKI